MQVYAAISQRAVPACLVTHLRKTRYNVSHKAVSALSAGKERGMQPEWSGDPEVKPVFFAITLTGAVAFLLMVWLFAFYW